jgi:hypothetical protein
MLCHRCQYRPVLRPALQCARARLGGQQCRALRDDRRMRGGQIGRKRIRGRPHAESESQNAFFVLPAVARYAGLTGSPDESGKKRREKVPDAVILRPAQ